ncbi:MAG: hypothetical protein U0518_00950 [Candidatus Gracilibacteria bacterium]
MKNSLVRIIISLMTLGLLASCTAKPTNTTTPTGSPANEAFSGVSPKIQSLEKFQSCVKTSVKTCGEESAKIQARDANDLSWCNLIADEKAKQSCQTSVIYSHAITAQDENICKDLADDTMKSMCRSQIVSAKATKAQDITLCDTLTTTSASGVVAGVMTGANITATGSNSHDNNDRNSEMCRMRVIQSINAIHPNDKACEKMKTEEGKTNCQNFMKTMKEREKEMNQDMPPMPPIPPTLPLPLSVPTPKN